MKQAYKKRSHEATANSPPGLPDMGKLLYKSKRIALTIPPSLESFVMIPDFLILPPPPP